METLLNFGHNLYAMVFLFFSWISRNWCMPRPIVL